MKLKITKMDGTAVIALPEALMARLQLNEGDEFFAMELQDGLKLVRYDREFARQMEVAEQVMDKEHELLRKLADS